VLKHLHFFFFCLDSVSLIKTIYVFYSQERPLCLTDLSHRVQSDSRRRFTAFLLAVTCKRVMNLKALPKY